MSAEAQANGLRAAKFELLARERDTIYLTRTKTIFKEAPDTCLTYLLAMQMECDTLVQLHRNVSLAKDTLIDTLKAIIVNRNSVIANDSVVKVGLREEVKVAEKQIKRAKVVTKVVTWIAGVAVLFSFGFAALN